MGLRLILSYSEHYEDRLNDLNMLELTIYLDLLCWHYLEKSRNTKVILLVCSGRRFVKVGTFYLEQ